VPERFVNNFAYSIMASSSAEFNGMIRPSPVSVCYRRPLEPLSSNPFEAHSETRKEISDEAHNLSGGPDFRGSSACRRVWNGAVSKSAASFEAKASWRPFLLVAAIASASRRITPATPQTRALRQTNARGPNVAQWAPTLHRPTIAPILQTSPPARHSDRPRDPPQGASVKSRWVLSSNRTAPD
jgi:hypothetical protein